MAELTNEEIGVWRQDPVTRKILERIMNMERELKEMLVQGVPNYDYTRGFIEGVRYINNIEGDEVDGNQ